MMDPGLPSFVAQPAGILLTDLVLAGDNAIIVGLLCRGLSPRLARPALLIGVVAAVAIRFVFSAAAGTLLSVSLLRLIGGLLLVLVALKTVLPDAHAPSSTRPSDPDGFVQVVLRIVLVDLLMSLDNILALAALAEGDLFYLAVGLSASAVILVIGSGWTAAFLRRHPDLIRYAGALLGWLGARIALQDPLFGSFFQTQSPALPLLIPAMTATFVFLVAVPVAVGADFVPIASVPVPQPPRVPRARAPQPPRPALRSINPELAVLIGLSAVAGTALFVLGIYGGV